MGEYFDYKAAAKGAGIAPNDLAALRRMINGRYASQMLREMHLLNLCTEIGAGRLTVADALKPPDGKLPPPSKMRMGG